jgi:hypothetical protein
MRDGADLRERQGQAAKQQGKAGNIDQRQAASLPVARGC